MGFFKNSGGLLVLFLLLAGTATPAQTVQLQVDKGGAERVQLSWTGAPFFEIYRAGQPDDLLESGNLLLETLDFSAVDDPPPGGIQFYKVISRADCLRPMADAYVSSLSPFANFGAEPEIGAGLEPVFNEERRSFLKFSMDGIPTGSVIEEATLVLEQFAATGPATYKIFQASDPWTESAVTWNNQPATDRSYSSVLQPDGIGDRLWDITELVAYWTTPKANHGLMLSTKELQRAGFHSRETGLEELPRLCVRWHDPLDDAVADLQQDSEEPVGVRFEDETAATIDARVVATSNDPVKSALDFLNQNSALFGLGDAYPDLFLDRIRSWENLTAVSFGRRVGDHPVLDETLMVFTDGVDVWGSSSGLRSGRSFQGTVELTAAQAQQAAVNALAGQVADPKLQGAPRVYWVPTETGGSSLRPAYWVTTAGEEIASGQPLFQTLFIDAETGTPLLTVDVSSTADRPGERFNVRDAANNWSDTCFWLPWEWKTIWFTADGPTPDYPGAGADLFGDGQSVSDGMHDIYHYFLDNHGWGGLGGRGRGGTAYAHWNVSEFNNARFTPICNTLSFGDGWTSPDIVGHEFTHGVVFFSVPLWFTDQPGALNEHLGDFFGSQLDGNWQIAEGRVDADAGAIRNMSNPPLFSSFGMAHPDHMDDYRFTGLDNSGVHINNGIPNKAAFLLTDGGSHRGISTAGIGRTKAGGLLFSVMVSHLHPWSSFGMLRDEMVREATRFQRLGILGFTVQDVCDVINAYAAVGLGNPDTDCDGVPNDPTGDGDGDGVADGADNCPLVSNRFQTDLDGDGIGNVCDTDMDGDGALNDADNCPRTVNTDQSDVDGDGDGDVCDDEDFDRVLDIDDNCPFTPNNSQLDRDNDLVGDACDPDLDGDGVNNGSDNCPELFQFSQINSDGDDHGDDCDNCDFNFNNDQSDLDNDDVGDVCDPDRDGDGWLNGADNCPDLANTQQLDNDGDGEGTICDDDERAFFDGLAGAQQMALFLEHFDITQALRIQIDPCTDFSCPDRLDENFNTSITLTDLTIGYGMRVVDDRGFVVDEREAFENGSVQLTFSVDHEYFYRHSPGSAPFHGRQYFLELFAPPGSNDGQILEGLIQVESSLD